MTLHVFFSSYRAQLSPKKGGALLNLSTHSLGVKTCSVLGKALSTDRVFTEIRLNDCMLPEEGTVELIYRSKEELFLYFFRLIFHPLFF